MKPKLIFILVALVISTAFITTNIILKKIEKQYQKFANLYHIQKVFIHTDKQIYQTGEHIWFKLYLLDDLHRLDTISKMAYVELIGPNRELLDVRILKLKHGMGIGDFYLPDTLISGIYLIRGYTNLMKNFGEEFFFKKIITIKNPDISYLPENIYLDIKSILSKRNKLKINYQLNTGQVPVVAIKNSIFIRVTDILGNPKKDISIKLKENGKTILETKTNFLGFAKIEFIPKSKKRYAIIVNNQEKVRLPKPIENGIALNINDNIDFFVIKLIRHSNKPIADQNKNFYLIAERNGKIYFKTYGKLDSVVSFKLNKKVLPSGIIHFVLFDYNGKPILDQIAFTRTIKTVPVNIAIEQLTGNQYKLEINSKYPIFALASTSITTPYVIETQPIHEYLSTKADIPSLSIHACKDSNINQYINALKWTRYTPQFIWGKKQIDTPKYKVQKSLTVSGRITRLYFNIPVKGTKVKLTVLNAYNDEYYTTTDEKGRFYFTGLNYNDTIVALVEARTPAGTKNVIVYIDKYDTIPTTNFNPITNLSYKLKFKSLKTPEIKQWQNDRNALHSHVDQVIYIDELQVPGNTNVFDFLQGRVPGFFKEGDVIYFRGRSSITQNIEPLYLIDNVPVDADAVRALNIADIERIEIIKNKAYSSIYGAKGANGVIAIYTKQGHKIIRGYWKETQPGYYTPQKFTPLPDSTLIKDPYATYYWEPQLVIQNGKASLKFKVPKNTKKIKVIIQGVSLNGYVIYEEKEFAL